MSKSVLVQDDGHCSKITVEFGGKEVNLLVSSTSSPRDERLAVLFALLTKPQHVRDETASSEIEIPEDAMTVQFP